MASEKINLLNKFYGVKTLTEENDEKTKKKDQAKNDINRIMDVGGNFKSKEDAKIIYKNVYNKLIPKLDMVKNARITTLLKNKKIKWEKISNEKGVKMFTNSLYMKYFLNEKSPSRTLYNIEKSQKIVDVDLNKKLYGYEMYEYISEIEDTYIILLPNTIGDTTKLTETLSFKPLSMSNIEFGDKILSRYNIEGDGIIYSTRPDLMPIDIIFNKVNTNAKKNVGLVNDTLLNDKLIIREPNIHSSIVYIFNVATNVKTKTLISVTLSDYFSFEILQNEPDITQTIFSPSNLYLYDVDTLNEINDNFQPIEFVKNEMEVIIEMYSTSDKNGVKNIRKYFSIYNKFYSLAKSLKKMILNGSTSNSIKKMLTILRSGIGKDKSFKNVKELEDLLKETYTKHISYLQNVNIDNYHGNLENFLRIKSTSFLENKKNLSFSAILNVFITLTSILGDVDLIDAIRLMQDNKYKTLTEKKIKEINDEETGDKIINNFNSAVSGLREVLKIKRKFEIDEIKKNIVDNTGEIDVDVVQKILGVKRKFDDVFANVEDIGIEDNAIIVDNEINEINKEKQQNNQDLLKQQMDYKKQLKEQNDKDELERLKKLEEDRLKQEKDASEALLNNVKLSEIGDTSKLLAQKINEFKQAEKMKSQQPVIQNQENEMMIDS